MLGAEDAEITRTWGLAWRNSQVSPPLPSVLHIVSWLRQELCHTEPGGRLLRFVGESSLTGATERSKEKPLSHTEKSDEELQRSGGSPNGLRWGVVCVLVDKRKKQYGAQSR